MKKFIKDILSSDSNQSSKRLSGLLSLITCIIFASIATIKQKGLTPDYMFNGLLIFAAGAFAITGMEKIFKKDSSDTTTNDPN
jgi:hypothetical protein